MNDKNLKNIGKTLAVTAHAMLRGQGELPLDGDATETISEAMLKRLNELNGNK